MAESLTHDVLILGAGLAGLRAAVELSHRLDGKVDIGIVSKVQLMRAHSVCPYIAKKRTCGISSRMRSRCGTGSAAAAFVR